MTDITYQDYINNLKDRVSDAKKSVNFGNTYNEGAEGYNPYGHTDTATNMRDLKVTEERLDEALDWTKEKTITRREKWNADIQASEEFKNKKPMFRDTYLKYVKKHGFSIEILNTFVKLHGLKKGE